jgi:phosphate transport system protein
MSERHFDQKLGDLKQRMLRMAGAVEQSIQEAVRSLTTRDDALAQKVISDEKDIDQMEIEIEEEALTLFALRQPVASDLRLIAAVIKANTDLERINDKAIDIAQEALILNRLPLLKPFIDIPRMADVAEWMVKNALDAFVNRDVALADAVRLRDDELDNLRDQIFRELLTYMMVDPATIDRAIHLILISRHLERIGDHASNIAEDVVYVVQGLIVRHRKEELRSSAGAAPSTNL